MTIRTALVQGTKLLEEASIGAPRLTAEVLLSFAIGCERIYLFTHSEADLSQNSWLHYGRYLWQRLAGKPTQYIVKVQEFYGRPFKVTPAVLIPRPETEHLIDAALAVAGTRVLDIGTGSGAIAITLALEGRAVSATDLSAGALPIAAENARNLNAHVGFVQCDLGSAFAERSFDLVVSNPPYIAREDEPGLQPEVKNWEPHLALFSMLDIYARIAADAARVLEPGGWLMAEIGAGQSETIRAMLDSRWTDVAFLPDLAGIPRVLTARLAI
jgi:release factor glutamine methyltransferase